MRGVQELPHRLFATAEKQSVCHSHALILVTSGILQGCDKGTDIEIFLPDEIIICSK
jgi:hypothetical protein